MERLEIKILENMKINYIVVPMLAVALLAGCKQKEQEAAVDVVVPVEEERIAEEPQEEKPVALVVIRRMSRRTCVAICWSSCVVFIIPVFYFVSV